MHVPYKSRYWKSASGKFFYVQPFADVQLRTDLVELILDNNAFVETTANESVVLGARCIPTLRGLAVNPYPALAEQWISNPQFCSNREKPDEPGKSALLDSFVSTARKVGIVFAQGYTNLMIGNLRAKELELRYDLGIIYGYLAAIRSIQRRKAKLDAKLDQLSTLLKEDIPCFNGLVVLAILTFYFQANRNATDETGKQVISFLDSFFAQKNDEPIELSPAYLRNRAADLWCWYLFPRLYEGKTAESLAESGTPILVTADKFLASIPFRFIPPVFVKAGNGTCLEFRFCPDGLAEQHQQNLLQILPNHLQEVRGETSLECQVSRLMNLRDCVMDMLEPDDKNGLRSAFHWVSAIDTL